MGRNDEGVTSTFIKFIEYMREEKKFFGLITLWPKTKIGLSTLLCIIVNNKDYACEMITIIYFEAGHTFMAANSFHKQIEDEMNIFLNQSQEM